MKGPYILIRTKTLPNDAPHYQLRCLDKDGDLMDEYDFGPSWGSTQQEVIDDLKKMVEAAEQEAVDYHLDKKYIWRRGLD